MNSAIKSILLSLFITTTTNNEILQFLTKIETFYYSMPCLEKHLDLSSEKNILLFTTIKYALKPNRIYENSVTILSNTSFLNTYSKYDAYIMYIRNFEEFNLIMDTLTRAFNWNPRAKFIVLLKENEEINQFFLLSWERYVTNINVIANNGKIYTYFPFADKTCGENITYELVSTCLSETVNMFPPKIPLNMNGCNLRIMAFPMIPYVIDIDSSRNEPNLAGLEITILNALSEKMNFTQIYVPCPYKSWGFKDSTGKYQMMFKSLFNNETDIITGMTFGNASHVIDFDGSYVYLMDCAVWWVPSAQPLPNWKNLTTIFEGSVWFAMFAIIFLNGFVWWLLGRNKETIELYNDLILCLMNSLYSLLQGSIQAPKKLKLRIVFICWLITCVLLFTAHQSSLVSNLTSPIFEHQMSTVEELVKSDLSFGFYPGAANAFEENNWIFREILKRYQPCPLSLECMNRTAYDRNFAFLRNQRNAKYFIPRYYTLPNGRSMVYQLDISGPGIWVRMHTVKGLPLLEHLNKYLMLLQSNGLMAKWDSDTTYKILQLESDAEHTALNISHLQGAFFILFIGEILAFLTFICEAILTKTHVL